MSYHFAIVGTKDNPLFEYEFGTSKQGGDGKAHFREEARRMNQFVLHSSLDIAEEVQWTSGAMYAKSIDRFYNNYISLFLAGSGAKFLLLHCPDPSASHNAHLYPLGAPGRPGSGAGVAGGSAGGSGATTDTSKRASANTIAANPTGPVAEEAIRQFFADVYENWVKTVMSPFYIVNTPIRSPIFRARVAAAATKYL